LRGTQVKDADLKVIKELANLQTLYLGRTQITDAGLAELKGMKNLRFLGLLGASVTEDGVKAIRTALPDCQVASSLGR
jgi:internalin A